MTTELNKYSDEHTDFRIMIILYVVEIKWRQTFAVNIDLHFI